MRSPAPLYVGLGLFVLVLAYLLASSLLKPAVPEFEPRHTASGASGERGAGPDTLTVDAGDERRWRFVDLDRGVVRDPPDTTGWDLAIRRYHVVPAREVADAGVASFDLVARPPASGYIPSTFAGDTTNPAIRRWYSYGMLSHLLLPKGHVYVVRTSGDRVAKLELISYYCRGLRAGCLTFRYGFLD
jgi:hypothetical protein